VSDIASPTAGFVVRSCSKFAAAVASAGLIILVGASSTQAASTTAFSQTNVVAAPVSTSTVPLTAIKLCGAPANPFRYSFCTPGRLIYKPPSTFCRYFHCIAGFWASTKGYVAQCVDRTYSHSGGRSGACSHHRGVYRALRAH
jgi:hypothetical protein